MRFGTSSAASDARRLAASKTISLLSFGVASASIQISEATPPVSGYRY